MPQRIVRPPPWPCAAMAMNSTANMMTLTMRMPVVTGAWPPKSSERPLLTLAMENLRLVPQL